MVAQVKIYTVHAERAEGWWGLTVPEVPGAVSQVRSLAHAEDYVREAIAFVTGLAADTFGVDIIPQLPEALAVQVAEVRAAAAAAEQAQALAGNLSRAVVAKLASAGFNGRETAVILGLSKQRVSQLGADTVVTRHPRTTSRHPAKGATSAPALRTSRTG
jgi:predicted RNase H-like HicB family nuclease